MRARLKPEKELIEILKGEGYVRITDHIYRNKERKTDFECRYFACNGIYPTTIKSDDSLYNYSLDIGSYYLPVMSTWIDIVEEEDDSVVKGEFGEVKVGDTVESLRGEIEKLKEELVNKEYNISDADELARDIREKTLSANFYSDDDFQILKETLLSVSNDKTCLQSINEELKKDLAKYKELADTYYLEIEKLKEEKSYLNGLLDRPSNEDESLKKKLDLIKKILEM